MAEKYDLRELAELTAPERAFLTVCLSRPGAVEKLEKRFERVRRLLKGGGAEKDEREHFGENVRMVQDYLARHPFESGSLCLFACWALDFFKAVPLAKEIDDLVWIDSSPYIRPLAEFEEEYESAAVVVADNKKARIFLVSMAVPGSEASVAGDIKNHVRKGGWSQQRYERRRDKELLHYARDIAEAVKRLHEESPFRRILLVGGKEILHIVHENLPQVLQDMVAEKAVDLGKGEGAVNEELLDLFMEQERQSERDLWERIRAEALRDGLGVVGLDEVLAATKAGQAEAVIVDRGFRPEGRRCRDCGDLTPSQATACPACGSTSLYPVDVVNEIVELLEQSGAAVDFADPIDTLTQAGRIGALLRYRL